jgi:glycerol-3-phosphate O-acyltransferase
MDRETNPALRALNRWFFDKMKVDETWVAQVREVARRGDVVYVLRSLNLVDYFALDHLTRRFDLPRVRYANDVNLGSVATGERGVLEAHANRRMSETERLRTALEQGSSAALFLKRPPGVIDVAAGASGGRGLREGDDHLRTLIELQRSRQRPILLVPQLFVWTNRPDTLGTHWLDVLLGSTAMKRRNRIIARMLTICCRNTI